jgi:predicted RNA-binding Zn-ribbon protein involved in translation (DUF1610 family)
MSNATFVRAQCDDCGIVRVTIADVALRVCADNRELSYVFRCPQCGGANARQSTDGIIGLLVRAGASVETWRLPAELFEARPLGPVLTPDDLLDFHLALEQPDWFDDLLELPRST